MGSSGLSGRRGRESGLRRWVRPDDIDAGRKEGLSTAELEELAQLRRGGQGRRGTRRAPQRVPRAVGEVLDGVRIADAGPITHLAVTYCDRTREMSRISAWSRSTTSTSCPPAPTRSSTPSVRSGPPSPTGSVRPGRPATGRGASRRGPSATGPSCDTTSLLASDGGGGRRQGDRAPDRHEVPDRVVGHLAVA